MPEMRVTRKNGDGNMRTDRIVKRPCRNQCGGIVIIRQTLKGTPLNNPSGLCRSCAAKRNIKGEKAHMLRALYEVEPSKSGRRWRVQCDCGDETTIHQANFGRTKSCGCLRNTLPSGQSERNRVLRGYKNNAKRRGLNWQLSDKDFDALVQTNCHYCGNIPSNVARWGKSNGSFTYNGIDRKNNYTG